MRQYSLEEAIEIGNKVTGVTSVLASTVTAFAIGVVLIKLLWAWTIPELFLAAVDQGLIAGELTWLAAIRVVVLFALLSSTGSLVVRAKSLRFAKAE